MNYYEHHLGDYAKDTTSLTMLEHGAYRLLVDFYYTKEHALPADLVKVYKAAKATNKAEREAVDSVLEEFFTQTPQGFIHKKCDELIEKFHAGQAEAEQKNLEKKENDKERQARARARRSELFSLLREHGIVPPFDTKNKELELLLSRVTPKDVSGVVTPNVTRDNTASQEPDPNPQLSPSLRSGEDAGKPAPRKKREDTNLKTYLEACKQAGIRPLPADHPIRSYCADAHITDEMLQLAWIVFKDRFTGKDKAKRQKDWPAHFANSVRGRWANLWFTDEKGVTGWTSAGLQERTVAEARLKPQHGDTE